jgi:uncharacterized protein (DUF2141 family)
MNPGPYVMTLMRFSALTATAAFFLLGFQCAFGQQPKQGTLTLIIEALKNDEGSVRVALSNSEENYYDYPNPTIGMSAPIHGRIARLEFRNLPFGVYAIKAFHDENGDGELDTNFLGIPVEDYGFSNNASGLLGPPSWEHASFRFASDTLTVRISFD